MEIRPYHKKDRAIVIELVKSNIPKFFSPSELKDFERYLDDEIEDYFVALDGHKIIGAGGINYFPEERTARISWDIIDPGSQGKGVGRKLTEHRINHINTKKEIQLIVVRTSQLVYKFYQKMGFVLSHIEKDFWAKGFDLYQMELENKYGQ